MNFSQIYTPVSEKDDIKNKDKKVLSDDFFAIGLILDSLISKIEHLRMEKK